MKLLSWNIQWGRGADGVVNLQRTISAIRTLGDFDVICLQEVVQGWALNAFADQAAEIADRLNMSVATVKTHILNMLEKTGFRNRTELAVRARESGLVILNRRN